MKNKKIGLIGGVGPQATQLFYGRLIELANEKYGAKNNDDFPRIVIESVPVPDFISDKSHIPQAKEMLIDSTQSLVNAGATNIGIVCNTVHLLLDDLKKVQGSNFISMIDSVIRKCIDNGYKKVGILASPVTLESGLYTSRLELNRIQYILPTAQELYIIEKVIRSVIAAEGNTKTLYEYTRIIYNMLNNGAEAIILGCTELPLAINYEQFNGKIINSIDLLANDIIDSYYH